MDVIVEVLFSNVLSECSVSRDASNTTQLRHFLVNHSSSRARIYEIKSSMSSIKGSSPPHDCHKAWHGLSKSFLYIERQPLFCVLCGPAGRSVWPATRISRIRKGSPSEGQEFIYHRLK